MPAGALDEIPVFQQFADAERNENPAMIDGGLREIAKFGGRQAFDDDIAGFRKALGVENFHGFVRHDAPRFFVIARADRHELQAGNAGNEALRHFATDRTEAGDANFQGSFQKYTCLSSRS